MIEKAPKTGSDGCRNNTAKTGTAKIKYVRIILHIGQSAEFIIFYPSRLLVHIGHRFELTFKIGLSIFASLNK